MNGKGEHRDLFWIVGIFLFVYFIPLENTSFGEAVVSGFSLLRWYAREHILLCLVPAFFIAGVIAVFLSRDTVIQYLGPGASRWIAYLVASGSGAVLAVCSCTVLPLFAGIYRRGAGVGPAVAFLYAGPAINILAIILTARILGFELGVARVIGAVGFSIIIGLIMAGIYRREEGEDGSKPLTSAAVEHGQSAWKIMVHFMLLVLILLLITWGDPGKEDGFMRMIFMHKWYLAAIAGIGFLLSLIYVVRVKPLPALTAGVVVAVAALLSRDMPLIPFLVAVAGTVALLKLTGDRAAMWLEESWGFARQILPLLAGGVLVAGFLLGTPEGGKGVVPVDWISSLVGGNSARANLFASVSGAFMYFATLTEIPIVEGLMNAGMGKGPALALLLAGPALSLPNMLVIRSVIGTRKTLVYVFLVILMATISGLLYGALFP